MYKQSIDKDTQDAIRRGHVPTLLAVLHKLDKQVVTDLKHSKAHGDVAFLQGISHLADDLIKLLEDA